MKNQIGHGKIIGFFLLAVMLCLSACGAPAEKEDARQPEAEERWKKIRFPEPGRCPRAG